MASRTLAALQGWRRALAGSLALPGPDLTVRQLALLLTVYTTPAPHTVTGLAEALGLSHQVVSRAVAALEGAGLVRRARDPADRRVAFVKRTVKGAVYLDDVAQAARKG
jgi:DNA-binding MarR family transcriptional regulator